MRKGSKNYCKSSSHKLVKDKVKTRVDDLQGVFMDLQFARKENQKIDVVVLEEQVHQMLREWKSELNEPSPASSLQHGGSFASFSSDICRLLQLCEEEDDAISPLAVPKMELKDSTLQVGVPQTNERPHKRCYPSLDQCKESLAGVGLSSNNVDNITELEQLQYKLNNGMTKVIMPPSMPLLVSVEMMLCLCPTFVVVYRVFAFRLLVSLARNVRFGIARVLLKAKNGVRITAAAFMPLLQ